MDPEVLPGLNVLSEAVGLNPHDGIATPPLGSAPPLPHHCAYGPGSLEVTVTDERRVIIMRTRLCRPSPELQTARSPVPGEEADIVHARAAVITDVVARVEVARALAPPLPRLEHETIDITDRLEIGNHLSPRG